MAKIEKSIARYSAAVDTPTKPTVLVYDLKHATLPRALWEASNHPPVSVGGAASRRGTLTTQCIQQSTAIHNGVRQFDGGNCLIFVFAWCC